MIKMGNKNLDSIRNNKPDMANISRNWLDILSKLKMKKEKIYKESTIDYFSNLRIVSMNPGDRKVAGCFNYSKFVGGVF